MLLLIVVLYTIFVFVCVMRFLVSFSKNKMILYIELLVFILYTYLWRIALPWFRFVLTFIHTMLDGSCSWQAAGVCHLYGTYIHMNIMDNFTCMYVCIQYTYMYVHVPTSSICMYNPMIFNASKWSYFTLKLRKLKIDL